MRSLALLLLLLTGCSGWSVVVPVAPPVAPPTAPPVTPPTFPPVTPPPAAPPADVAAFLARIVVGATVAEANAAVGQMAVIVTGSGGAPTTARWSIPGFVVYAVVVDGRVARKGSTPLETTP